MPSRFFASTKGLNGDNPQTNPSFWDRGVWLCPGVTSRGILGQSFQSYGYNAYGLGSDSNSLGLGGHYGITHVAHPDELQLPGGAKLPVVKPPVSVSEVVNPSEMMAIGDGFHGNGTEVFSGQDLLWRHNSYEGFRDLTPAKARHLSKANVVYCDGHVESLSLKALFENTNDAAYLRWNRDDLPHRQRLQP